MNIIRTSVVELSKAPALAYKYKLKAGGAGIKILYEDTGNTETFSISRRGELAPYQPGGAVSEAALEALELTQGLPYSARGKVKAVAVTGAAEEDEAVPETPAYDMIESAEYKAWIKAYISADGKMNYAKMNKDLIQFAGRNKTVAAMVSEGEPRESILRRVVQIQTSNLTKNKEYMTPEAADALIGTLEELDTRSAFKELTLHLTRMLSGRK
ncbi:MAG: hypothetical protein FWG72_08315 [Oscillospiraceae bacterium]|nr:hypothetical protein [Oscillospiraceae bacterium]